MADNGKNQTSRSGVRQRSVAGRSPRSRAARPYQANSRVQQQASTDHGMPDTHEDKKLDVLPAIMTGMQLDHNTKNRRFRVPDVDGQDDQYDKSDVIDITDVASDYDNEQMYASDRHNDATQLAGDEYITNENNMDNLANASTQNTDNIETADNVENIENIENVENIVNAKNGVNGANAKNGVNVVNAKNAANGVNAKNVASAASINDVAESDAASLDNPTPDRYEAMQPASGPTEINRIQGFDDGDVEHGANRMADGAYRDIRNGNGASRMAGGANRDVRNGNGAYRDVRNGNGANRMTDGAYRDARYGNGPNRDARYGNGINRDIRNGNGPNRDVRNGNGVIRDIRNGNGANRMADSANRIEYGSFNDHGGGDAVASRRSYAYDGRRQEPEGPQFHANAAWGYPDGNSPIDGMSPYNNSPYNNNEVRRSPQNNGPINRNLSGRPRGSGVPGGAEGSGIRRGADGNGGTRSNGGGGGGARSANGGGGGGARSAGGSGGGGARSSNGGGGGGNGYGGYGGSRGSGGSGGGSGGLRNSGVRGQDDPARGARGSEGARGSGGVRGSGGARGSEGARNSGGGSGDARNSRARGPGSGMGSSRGAGGPNSARSPGGSRGAGGGSRGSSYSSSARRGAPGKSKKTRITQIINICLIALSLVVITAIIFLYNNNNNRANVIDNPDDNVVSANSVPETMLSYENVYDGVFVSGADVSGLTYEELLVFLNSEFGGSLDSKFISIKIGEVTEKHSFTELGVRYNIDEAARQAFEIGRTGSNSDRLRRINELTVNPVNLQLVYTYDQDKVNELANRIAEDAGVLTEDADVRYTPTAVVIKPGREGVRLDRDDLTMQLRDALDNFESADIEANLIMSQPDKIDAESIFSTINKEPVNAYYKVSDDHKSVSIIDEQPGQSVDREKLISAIESLNSNSSAEVTIPLLVVEPTVKKADLGGALFNDKLGSASTNFSVSGTNNRNRRDNMTLATQTITGYILAPGDEFAFNEAVGKRTEANGYKMAGAFMNGQLIDDVGGGICQVSSTLYNAVLLADLSVTVRSNHSYIVGYVKQGFDATVSYPQPDFKFKNNSAHPVRIDCHVEGTSIYFTLLGTQVGPKKTITFSSNVIQTKDFNHVTTEDPTKLVGTIDISQAGRTGYTIDTYKTVQVGDGPKETIKIATNIYKTMDQIETVGTKPVPPGTTVEEIITGPDAGEEDYISDAAGQTQPSGDGTTTGGTTTDGNNGTGDGTGGEETTTEEGTRPIRTPRPTREPVTDTTEPAAGGTTTTAGTTEPSTSGSTPASESTTAPAAESTTAPTTEAPHETTTTRSEETTTIAPTTAAATTAASGDGGGGDGGEGGGEAPKRTPRPPRE